MAYLVHNMGQFSSEMEIGTPRQEEGDVGSEMGSKVDTFMLK
jgi:hypothetical protein